MAQQSRFLSCNQTIFTTAVAQSATVTMSVGYGGPTPMLVNLYRLPTKP